MIGLANVVAEGEVAQSCWGKIEKKETELLEVWTCIVKEGLWTGEWDNCRNLEKLLIKSGTVRYLRNHATETLRTGKERKGSRSREPWKPTTERP